MSVNVEECFAAHRARVYRWALALCGREQDAADVVSDVFLRLIRSRPALPDAARAVAWLRRATSHAAIDRWRRRSRLRVVSDEPDALAERRDGADVEPDERERLSAALAELSEQQRLVLMCKTYDQMSFAEIAGQLGLAVATVKTHYMRGLAALRERLGAGTRARGAHGYEGERHDAGRVPPASAGLPGR